MNNDLFEVTTQEVKSLTAEDLQELIGRLCIADIILSGKSSRHVKFGGDINTPDGGIDILVDCPEAIPQGLYVPRKLTGFQVKKPKMEPRDICKEMSKYLNENGSITRLIKNAGAYILVSSGQSCNVSQLMKRENAMREAVSQVTGYENLEVAFYDNHRIVNWVNEYPGLIAWVKSKVGIIINGWKPYENWSNGDFDEFFIDEIPRFHSPLHGEVKISEGIKILREQLAKPGSSSRLIGLSGVGKTKLLEALFNKTIGENPLSEHLACYTNLEHNPNPSPEALIQHLTINKKRIVLIIDNCSSSQHKTLSDLIKNSEISLITVEYDIREDFPPDTSVFQLEASSKDVLGMIIKKRYPEVNDFDLDRITTLSEGNSRVALAIMKNYEDLGDFSTLKDDSLFKRLFYQKNTQNESLLETAKACSLVFSFNHLDPSYAESEIPLLSQVGNQTIEEFYRNLVTIKNRGLLQSRGQWSALLPHSIANNLAVDALRGLTNDTIKKVFLGPNSSRLLSSFFHRLSFLHKCKRANELANAFFNQSIPFESIDILSEEYITEKLAYLLPIDLDASLDFLHRIINEEQLQLDINSHNKLINWLPVALTKLAYFEDKFDPAFELIKVYVLKYQSVIGLDKSLQERITNLFRPIYPFTLSTPKTRHQHIVELLNSAHKELFNLGLSSLDSGFKTTIDYYWFEDFGARPLSSGYRFSNNDEIRSWFSELLRIATESISKNPINKSKFLSVVSRNFRNLWGLELIQDDLISFIHTVTSIQPWVDIWNEIQKTILYDSEKMSQHSRDNLKQLSDFLKPKSLMEELLFALKYDCSLSLGTESKNDHKQEMIKLGINVANNFELLRQVGGELFTSSSCFIDSFVESLTLNTKDRLKLWHILSDSYKEVTGLHWLSVFIAFFKVLWLEDPSIASKIQDEIITDDDLYRLYPVTINRDNVTPDQLNALTYLISSKQPLPAFFSYIPSIPLANLSSDNSYKRLIEEMSKTPAGFEAALQIVTDNFQTFKGKGITIPQKALKIGKDLLFVALDPSIANWKNSMTDFYVSRFLENLIEHNLSASYIQRFLMELLPEGFHKNYKYSEYHEVTTLIAKHFPYILLDTIFARIGNIEPINDMALLNSPERIENLMRPIEKDILLKWLDEDLRARAIFLSRYCSLIEKSSEQEEIRWSMFGEEFLSKTYVIPSVLENMLFRLEVRSWSGDRSNVIKKRLSLFSQDSLPKLPELNEWKKQQLIRYQKLIKDSEKIEAEMKEGYLRFE